MRKNQLILISLVCSVFLPLSHFDGAPTQLFDLKKCRQELEVMRGILRTTLQFASQELTSESSTAELAKAYVNRGFEFSNLGALYLVGQGAIFTIPASDFDSGAGHDFALGGDFKYSFNFDDQQGWLEDLGSQMEEMRDQLAGIGPEIAAALAGPPVPPTPPTPGVAVTPQVPKPAPNVEREAKQRLATREKALKDRLSELQERVKKRNTDRAAREARFQEYLGQLKVFLVEALANHGDSLTIVKPNEYVNIVISRNPGLWRVEDLERSQKEILSVQKSVITDYKAGRLTMEAFKEKVMDYVN